MNRNFFAVATLCVLLSVAFAGCEINTESVTEQPSLTLNTTSLSITSAVATVTSRTLSATVEHSSAAVVWTSSDTNVVALSAEKGFETIAIVQGAGQANICAKTSDGTLSAVCKVTVTLGEISSHPISNFSVSGEPSVDTINLTWTESPDATGSKIVCCDTATGTVINTQYYEKGITSGSFSGLSQSTSYTFNGYGVINQNTSSEGVSDPISCIVVTAKDVTAPSSVTDPSVLNIGEHSVTLTWTDPSDIDYTNVVITASASGFDGNTISRVVSKGIEIVTISSLTAEKEYTFTLATEDKFGNIQGDANNTALTPATVTITTTADTTAPASVSNVSVTVNSITSVTLSWVDPTDADLKDIIIGGVSATSGVSDPNSVTIAAGTESATITVNAGANYTFTLKAEDYNSNKSVGVDAAASTEPFASNVVATTGYTGQVIVTWADATAVETGVTYTYTVTASDDSTTITKDSIPTGTQKAVFNGLSIGTSYTFTVKTTNETSGNIYTNIKTASAIPVKVLWFVINGYNPASSYAMIPDIRTSAEYYQIVCVPASERTTTNGFKYEYWIVLPSLVDPSSTDAFSLESSDSIGTESGYYLYLDPTRTLDSNGYDYNKWSYNGGSIYTPHAFVAKTTDSYFSSNLGYASFHLDSTSFTTSAVSGYTWKSIKWYSDTSKYLWGACLNVSGHATTTTYSDWAWGIKETTLTN